MSKNKNKDCCCEFAKDHFKEDLSPNKTKEKIRLENMYEFGEDYFVKTKKDEKG